MQLSSDYLQELNQLPKDEFIQAEHLRKFLTKVKQKVTKEAKKIAQEIVSSPLSEANNFAPCRTSRFGKWLKSLQAAGNSKKANESYNLPVKKV